MKRSVLAATHADHAILNIPSSYAFVAKAPLTPVTVDEFAAVAQDCPIVLVGPANAAFAATGLAPEHKLIEDAQRRARLLGDLLAYYDLLKAARRTTIKAYFDAATRLQDDRSRQARRACRRGLLELRH